MPSLVRACFFALSVFVLCVNASQQGTSRAADVVFVCEHGAAKSVIAAAHFNSMAEERGLPFRAVARGTNPDVAFSSSVLPGLKQEGKAAPAGVPQLVKASEIKAARQVVTLGCTLPELIAASDKTVDWNVPPPSRGYDASRDEIRRNVTKLLEQMKQSSGKK